VQTVQANRLQSLRKVEAFLEENADRLAGVIKTGTRQRLAEAVTALAAHASDQSGLAIASQQATLKQQALREVLLNDHMAHIARIAKADLPNTPELAPLRMPRTKLSAEKLAVAAYAMATAAAPYADVFTSAGLPTDFVAQLISAADAIRASVDERSLSDNLRNGATEGLKSKLAAGRKMVHVLDAFVRTAVKRDPTVLASWKAVAHVRKAAVRPAPTVVPAPTPTPGPITIPAPTTAQVAAAETN
jgi:hypothetical protein